VAQVTVMASAVKSTRSARLTDVCAVVVTHNPVPECVKNLTVLAPQVRHLLIVDNGSSDRSFAPIDEVAPRLGAQVVRLGFNLGTGAALNLALERARQHDCQWLAMFDQDSRPGMAMLERMLRKLESYSERERVGLITPVQIEESLGMTSLRPLCLVQGDGWRLLASALATGSLLNVASASQVGGFDASLFIDYVDHELCMRLRRQGYQIFEASDVRLMCRMGKLEIREILGTRPRIWDYSSRRRYYITRNRALLWRRYWRFDRPWVMDDMRNFLYETVGIVRWQQDALEKLWMMARGLFDALRNARGALRGDHR
jgi:rhamnosyltransferase